MKEYEWIFVGLLMTFSLLAVGGRYVLVKSMLENIPMFWWSLASTPKFILNLIKNRIFTFMWLGKDFFFYVVG